jgi:hypothetical protein
MSRHTLPEAMHLTVATLSRPRLLEALQRERVQLNASAQTLLEAADFDQPAPQSVTLVERSLSELGLEAGAALPRIFDVAEGQGLSLCPVAAGPYLRVIDGCPWLRGYRCDLTYGWNPDDRFVFAISHPGDRRFSPSGVGAGGA